MKRLFIPTSLLGKWSIGLIIAFLLFFALHMVIASAGHSGGGKTFFSNLALAIPMLFAAISGTAAFFTGVIAIIASKERSIPVFLTTLIGLFVMIFCLGEIISPH